MATHRPILVRPLLVGLALALLPACEQTIDRTAEIPPPRLTMVQAGQDVVQLHISGSYGLRALQGQLSYDASALKVTGVEPGKDAQRLDRVFHADPVKAAGSLVIGLSDTRRVMLPARGVLLRFHLQAAGATGGRTTVTLDRPLGAIDGGERVNLDATSLEVTVP